MTRHDANLLLDETFGGEDGTSPIRFGHDDAYHALGHMQHYHTRRGRVLKLARYRTPRAIRSLPLPSVERQMPAVRLANYGAAGFLLWEVIAVWVYSLVKGSPS